MTSLRRDRTRSGSGRAGAKRSDEFAASGPFPLPADLSLEGTGGLLGRRRRQRIEKLAGDAVWALNWMHGCGFRSLGRGGGGGAESGRAQSRLRVQHLL